MVGVRARSAGRDITNYRLYSIHGSGPGEHTQHTRDGSIRVVIDAS